MWPLISGVLVNIVGKFLVDLAYSESPSLSPELTFDVTSLSGSAGSLGVEVGPSVGCARFKFFTDTNICWCGGVRGGSLGENVGRKGSTGYGQ